MEKTKTPGELEQERAQETKALQEATKALQEAKSAADVLIAKKNEVRGIVLTKQEPEIGTTDEEHTEPPFSSNFSISDEPAVSEEPPIEVSPVASAQEKSSTVPSLNWDVITKKPEGDEEIHEEPEPTKTEVLEGETKTFSLKGDVEPIIRSLLQENNVEVTDIKINGFEKEIFLNITIVADKKHNINIKATLENKNDVIVVKDHKIDAKWLVKRETEKTLAPNLDKISDLLKVYIEKSEGKKTEKIWIEDGQLKALFKKEEIKKQEEVQTPVVVNEKKVVVSTSSPSINATDQEIKNLRGEIEKKMENNGETEKEKRIREIFDKLESNRKKKIEMEEEKKNLLKKLSSLEEKLKITK